jgi:hypothetical protein
MGSAASIAVASGQMNAVELVNSLYALGGIDGLLDTVQKLSLDSLTWELIQLKIPIALFRFPCFKTNTQVYLLIRNTRSLPSKSSQ